MTTVKISDLPAASALTGPEQLPVVQSGITSRTTINDIGTFLTSGGTFAASGNIALSGLTITGPALVGRAPASTGPLSPITIGSGLALSGTTLQTTAPPALPLSGGEMSGAIVLILGSATLPALTFKGDTNTGIFSPSGDIVAITTGGSERLRIDNAEVTVQQQVKGSASITATGRLIALRQDAGSNGGGVTLHRASDDSAAYTLRAQGSSSTPPLEVVREFGTPDVILSITDAGAVTLTGAATLPADPTAAMHAATKQYVDNSITNIFSQSGAIDVSGGTSFDFTGIPSWAMEVTVKLWYVSLTGADRVLIQLGTSSGIETSGYITSLGASSSSTSGFIFSGNTASDANSGYITFRPANATRTEWLGVGNLQTTNSGPTLGASGQKTLGGALTQLRVTRSGSNTFDAGAISVEWRR